MPDRRTDWTALLSAIAAVLVAAAATCLILVQCGCAARTDVAGYRRDNQTHATADTRQDAKGGRDVTINDPWTGRIAVLGLAGIPASFLLYLLSKRVPLARKVYDALSGKPCAERQAGRCIPSVWLEAGSALEGLAAQHRTDVDEFHVKHGPQDDPG